MAKGRGADNTGKSKKPATEQYFKLYYQMARSPAWRSMSGAAIKVFIEMRTRYHGGNNGQIYLGLRKTATLLGLSKSTVQRAFAELDQKGFLKMTERGKWYGRKATTYRVTDQSCDGAAPTSEWRHWKLPTPAKPPLDLSPDDPDPQKQSLGTVAGHPEKIVTG